MMHWNSMYRVHPRPQIQPKPHGHGTSGTPGRTPLCYWHHWWLVHFRDPSLTRADIWWCWNRYGQRKAGSTHPTRMHSCFFYFYMISVGKSCLLNSPTEVGLCYLNRQSISWKYWRSPQKMLLQKPRNIGSWLFFSRSSFQLRSTKSRHSTQFSRNLMFWHDRSIPEEPLMVTVHSHIHTTKNFCSTFVFT